MDQQQQQQQRDTSNSIHQAMKNSGKEPPKRPFMKKSRTGPTLPHKASSVQAQTTTTTSNSFPIAPPNACFIMPPIFAGPAAMLGMQQASLPTNPKDIIRQPNDWDVCMGDIEHPGTRAWREMVVQAALQDPLPQEGCNVADMLYQLRQKNGVTGRFLVKLKGMEGFRMATPWEVDWWTQQAFWHVVQRRQEVGPANISNSNLHVLPDLPTEEQLFKRAAAAAHLANAAAAATSVPKSNTSPSQSSNNAAGNSVNKSNNSNNSTSNSSDKKSLSLQQVFQDATSQLQRDEWLANQSTSSHVIQKGLKAHKALYYLQPFSTVATLVWSDIFKKRYEENAPGSKGGNSLEDRLDRARRSKETKKLEQAEQLCIQFVQGMMRVFLEDDDEDAIANDDLLSSTSPEHRKRPRDEVVPAVISNNGPTHSNNNNNNNSGVNGSRPRSHMSIAVDEESDHGGESKNSKRRFLNQEKTPSSESSSTSTAPNVILPDRPVVIPKARDVCFAMINHPGTKAWRETVDSLSSRGDLDWSINIHHLVKAQMEMEGRNFYVCHKQEQHRNKELRNAQWCLATDDEVMQKTRQRFRDFRKPPRAERPVRGGRTQNGSGPDDDDEDNDDDDIATSVATPKSPSQRSSPSFLAATMDKVVSTANDKNGKDPLARLASAAAFAPPAKVKEGEAKGETMTTNTMSNHQKVPTSGSSNKGSLSPPHVSE